MSDEATAQAPKRRATIIWDGVEYDLPIPSNVTPREDGRVHGICGCWTAQIYRERLHKDSLLVIAALLIVGMERKLGRGNVNDDAIIDSVDFETKLSAPKPEEEDEAVPPVAAAAEAAPAATTPTSEIPGPSGSLS